MDNQKQQLSQAEQEIIRAVQGIQYGSVEIVIHNSKVVQIEKKTKTRFDESK